MSRRLLPAARLSAALILLVTLLASPAPGQEKKESKPTPFAGRSGELKEKLLKLGGGSEKTEAAVAAGLKWLALHQAPDGHWSLTEFHKSTRTEPFPGGKVFEDIKMTGQGITVEDTAATALALLPFLGAGHTHKPNKALEPNYSKGVLAGLTWLARQQKPDGSFSRNTYAQALATLAVCEAYALTSDPKLKGSAQAALNYLVAFQHDMGGWRYTAREPGDLSITAWVVQAFLAGKAGGLTVPERTLKLADDFVDSCEDGANKGCYCYKFGGTRTPSMTGAALVTRLELIAIKLDNPKVRDGIDYLKTSPPGKDSNLYQDYYVARTMHRLSREAWMEWFVGKDGKDGLRDYLLKRMDTGDNVPTLAGSWAPAPDGYEKNAGRLFSTSLALLCLQTPYRHVPSWAELKPEK
jgi:hypothetical protein